MRGCAGSSSGAPGAHRRPRSARRPDLDRGSIGSRAAFAVLAAAMLAFSLGAGCAARRPTAGPAPAPGAPAAPLPGRDETAGAAGATPSAPESGGYPRLPGADRAYPSQDPRNKVNPDAPEAFPLGAASSAPVSPGSPGGRTVRAIPQPDTADTLRQGPPAEKSEAPAAGTPRGESATATPAPKSGWSVQLLASASAAVARERAAALATYFDEAPRVVPAAGLFRVRVGHCAGRDEAEALRRKAVELGLRDAFVVPVETGGDATR